MPINPGATRLIGIVTNSYSSRIAHFMVHRPQAASLVALWTCITARAVLSGTTNFTTALFKPMALRRAEEGPAGTQRRLVTKTTSSPQVRTAEQLRSCGAGSMSSTTTGPGDGRTPVFHWLAIVPLTCCPHFWVPTERINSTTTSLAHLFIPAPPRRLARALRAT